MAYVIIFEVRGVISLSKKGDFKVYLFITAFAATVIVGMGIYYLYNRFSIEEPLIAQFNAIEGVKATYIEKDKDIYLITFLLEPVENIQHQYEQLEAVADTKLGNAKYELMLNGHGSSELEQVYYHIQPVVYQALADNQYVWMRDEINKLTVQENVGWNMYIDANRLYLQLSDGDSYQYYIFERAGNENAV